MELIPFLPDSLSYAELPAVYAEELVPLLESSFNVFWSTVLYNETVLPFCDTFLRYAPRVEVTDDGCRSGWSGAGGQWEVRELERCREWEEEAKVQRRRGEEEQDVPEFWSTGECVMLHRLIHCRPCCRWF